MFRKICGDSSLKNVLLVTNMWNTIEKTIGEARETELASEEIFFKPALDKKARLLRHDNTMESARHILGHIIGHNIPMPLRIQEELVDNRTDLCQTAAAQELDPEIAEQARRHKQEMFALQREAQDAITALEEAAQAEICRIQAQELKITEDALRTEADRKEESSRLDREIREAAEAERQHAEKLAIEYAFLQHRLQVAEHLSAVEQRKMRRKLADLEHRVRRKHG